MKKIIFICSLLLVSPILPSASSSNNDNTITLAPVIVGVTLAAVNGTPPNRDLVNYQLDATIATDRLIAVKWQPIFRGVFLPTSKRSEISRLVQKLL